jgi:hypothetical protein
MQKEAEVETIDNEIAAYEALQSEFEDKYMGKWVLLRGGKLIGVFDSFEVAAQDAIQKFGRGPYLIRQVGASSITLPASVVWSFGHAKH